MAPIKASGAFLLLTAPLLLALAAAYPHRAYHDDADVQAPEKNVRHIDGLGSPQRAEEAMRQLQEQVKAQGGGSGSWSVRYSEYSSGSRGGDAGASSGAPVRATITGEAIEGADGVLGLSTNCHNCRMTIRKVGSGSVSGAGQYAGEQAAAGVQQSSQQSSQRYYSSRSEGGQAGQGSAYGAAYGGGRSDAVLGGSGASSSSRVVQSSRVVESSGYGASAARPEYGSLDAAALGGASGRKDTRVTKSSWQLSDLGYGTTNIEDLIRRLDDDMRAGRFQNGKTVTTVTTTTSENGSPPVTKQETFVKDGVVDVAALPGELGAGRPFSIGHSEVEDLLKGLRDDLREGKTQAGKTVTTVVESSSVNGGPPVVKKNTYVRDGFDASALETLGADAARLGLGAGQLDLGQSTGGGSRSVSRTTHSSWSSGGRLPQHVDHLGGGELLTKTHSTSRNSTSVSSYSSDSGHDLRAVDALGGGHLIRETGGSGYGAGASGSSGAAYSGSSSTLKETRRVDALGGGHLIRDTEQDYGAGSQRGIGSQYGAGSQYASSSQTRYGSSRYGSGSSHYDSAASELKNTRRVDSLGGGHLLRETDAQPTQETMSVSQMPGYRKGDSPATDAGAAVSAYGGTSKYYSTFQSSGGYAGGAVDGQQQAGVVDGGAVSSDGASRTSSSSSYKKVVSYSSSSGVTEERDVDRLGGGHLIRGVPGDVHRTDAGGNSAFIAAEQSGGRIPEAAPGSYFSSSYQRTAGSSGVNPAAPTGTVLVPVRGTASSGSVSGSAYGSRTEWSDAHESRDDEFPPLGPATTPSIKLGYGTGNGGYGGPPAAGASPDSGAQRGGKLSVSLVDIGILPPGSSSGGSTQQASQSGGYGGGSEYSSSSRYSSGTYGSSGSGYGASGIGYGSTGSGLATSGGSSGYGASVAGSGSRTYSRTYESSAPATAHSSSWSSHSTYSSGTPGASYGGAAEQGIKGGRMTQRGPDCDTASFNM